ncbi:hypothetical protein O6H91_12G084600 [Diphasiastrum complanatum]|nr:hypothetical protein O6H91_12G084600 [Diphasiastrum complanatum]
MKEDLEARVPVLVRGLEQVTLALLKLNVPSIASVCGHAAGGGLLFAMAHDHCCMRRDRGFLYCSAVDINFVIPPGSIALLKSKMTPKAFKNVVLSGVKFTAPMALDAGIIDSHHADANETFEAALKLATGLAERGWERAAYQALRLAMYSDVIEKLESNADSELIGFVNDS